MRVETIGDATLYLGDCMEVLPLLERVDAVITDPPYGIGFAAQPTKWQRLAGKKGEAWDDAIAPDMDALRALGDVQIIWGGNYYRLPPTRGWLSWFKPDAPPSMANFELAWTNQDRNARQLSVSIGATNAERVGHPTQKPLALMRWTIEQAGDVQSVADFFMGSGTTGVACAQLGRKFIGVERDPKYFDMACRRIEQAANQGQLFAPAQPKAEQMGLLA
jgi:site-specific DNA-methyltransferase (adenine-specific)/modification methylase